MLVNALRFLISVVFDLLTMLFLLRFFMQLFKVPFHNPLGMMVISLTDFAVRPARALIPSIKKWDISTLILAIVTQLLLQLSLLWLRDFPIALADNQVWTKLTGLSALGTLRITLDMFFYAILLQAILSWVNPHTPISGVIDKLTQPILNPIRRIVPVANGMDFSPLIALILLQMITQSFVRVFEAQLSVF